MRIGIDGRLWKETGVGRYIRALFYHLAEIDKENEYVWFFKKEEYDALSLPSKKWKKVKADVPWHTFREQMFLPWIFYREKLDLLHFPYFTFPILYPGKFVVTVHDLILDHYKTGKASTLPVWFYWIKKIGYHLVVWVAATRAEKILTLSNDAAGEISSHYRINPEKITVAYESGALEDRRKNFAGSEFNRMRKLQPYILYVGNAHPHKNLETLIESLKIIRKSEPDLRLVLVGFDRFFYPKIREFINSEGTGDSVVVIGEVPNSEIAGWYHFARALVTASRMEGFGIPPLEAMSVGCPAIVSDIPVFHEVYGDAAVYFDPDKPKEIARVIVETLADKKLIAEKIKSGFLQANKYSWEKLTIETHKVYESCLSIRPGK